MKPRVNTKRFVMSLRRESGIAGYAVVGLDPRLREDDEVVRGDDEDFARNDEVVREDDEVVREDYEAFARMTKRSVFSRGFNFLLCQLTRR
jgi:hypothetical protein